MEQYIALLRGINVSGQKKIKMKDLKDALATSKFKGLSTYIQSGNLVFQSLKNEAEITQEISGVIKTTFGFEVPVLVKKFPEFKTILEQNPLKDYEDKNLYFALLLHPPETEFKQSLEKEIFKNEAFVVTDTCVYFNCKIGYGKAKLNNNYLERKLKVQATTRNLKTMQTLVKMAEELG